MSSISDVDAQHGLRKHANPCNLDLSKALRTGNTVLIAVDVEEGKQVLDEMDNVNPTGTAMSVTSRSGSTGQMQRYTVTVDQ